MRKRVASQRIEIIEAWLRSRNLVVEPVRGLVGASPLLFD